MPRVCQKVPTAFPRHQCRHSSQQIARAHLPFSKRESIIFIGRGGAARPVAGGAAGPVAAGSGVASLLADDGDEGPVAGGGRGAAPAGDSAAKLLAVGGGGKAASVDNAAKDSQTGQTFPLQGQIVGATRSIMVS